jgi:D-xylose 1-dehydrogenase (NADP+, D-xylono-1,5-lactone-forming)
MSAPHPRGDHQKDDAGAPSTLRWGVLGATAYISGLLMPAIAATPGCTLATVASRPGREDQAAAAAAPFGATVRRDYAALLDDPDVDVVYLALPNSEHVEWTVRALGAGKHVLVEKPMAMHPDGCERIALAASTTDRCVMEAFMYRFHPQQRRAAELLAAGTVGELRVVRTSFAFPIPTGSGNIRLDRALGGGATWDVGCYAIDVPLVFFDQTPRSVQARFAGRTGAGDPTNSGSSRAGAEVETSAVGLMDFGDGRSAVLDYSIDYGPRAWYELQGTHGTITVRNAWAMRAEDGVLTVLTADGVREHRVPAVDHYQHQVAAFADAVRRGTPAPIPLAHSLRTARVGSALVASALAGGTPLAVADPGVQAPEGTGGPISAATAGGATAGLDR